MTTKEIYSSLKTLTPVNWELKFSQGVYYFEKIKKKKSYIIYMGYTDYEPKFVFSSLRVSIRFSAVENILEPLEIKYFNQDKRDSKFSTTVVHGVGVFSDQYRFEGIKTKKELAAFKDEVKDKVYDFAIPWLKENNTLEKLGTKIKDLTENDTKTIQYCNGQFALHRQIIIFHLLEEKKEYERMKVKVISYFEKLMHEKNEKKFSPYLSMLLDLTSTLENGELI